MLPLPARSPTNVPSPCNDRMLRPYDPTYVLADLPDEISLRTHRWVPHSKTSPNAAYIRFLIIVCMAHVCAYVGVFKYVCTSGVGVPVVFHLHFYGKCASLVPVVFHFWGGGSVCVRVGFWFCTTCVPVGFLENSRACPAIHSVD